MTEDVTRPTDAELHAYKAGHHSKYLEVTAREAESTNRLIRTAELPTEGTDPAVTPALDHLYSKAAMDLTSGPVTAGPSRGTSAIPTLVRPPLGDS